MQIHRWVVWNSCKNEGVGVEFAGVFWGKSSRIEEFRIMSWSHADSRQTCRQSYQEISSMILSRYAGHHDDLVRTANRYEEW